MSLFTELKRRNVFKVGAAYAVLAWVVMQVVDIVLPTFDAPRWVNQTLLFLIILGFPFALVLAWAFELTPDGIKAASDISPDANSRPQTGSKLNYVTIGGLAILLALVVLDAYVLSDPTEVEQVPFMATVAEPASDAAPPAAAASTEQTLAVLPFENLSDDADQEYFSDGLTEELINTLSRVDGLLVTGRASAFYFKDSEMPLAEIAGSLGVQHLLQGSVRRAGNDLRIAVQLTQAATGFTLWTQTYERQFDDIFAVQEAIASEVTTALSITFGAGIFAEPGMTRNVEAYDELLRARQAFLMGTPDSYQEAIVRAERAVDLDPDFALGWAMVAEGYGMTASMLAGTETEGYRSKGQEAAQRAVTLAPDSLRVALPRLTGMGFNQQWRELDAELQRMLALHGDDAEFNRAYGAFLIQVGRTSEALRYARRAQRQEPLSGAFAVTLEKALLHAAVPADETRAQITRNLGLPDVNAAAIYADLAFLEMEAGDWDAALVATQGTIVMREVQARLLTALIEDRAAEGRADIRVQLADPALQPVFNAKHLPAMAAALGDPELALDLFEDAGGWDAVVWTDLFSEVRRQPRFKVLAERFGYADYWRTTGNWADKCRPVNDDFECF